MDGLHIFSKLELCLSSCIKSQEIWLWSRSVWIPKHAQPERTCIGDGTPYSLMCCFTFLPVQYAIFSPVSQKRSRTGLGHISIQINVFLIKESLLWAIFALWQLSWQLKTFSLEFSFLIMVIVIRFLFIFKYFRIH